MCIVRQALFVPIYGLGCIMTETKKPRENRVPIMMSDEELTKVDDWRFANRIATRSDAIRKLCQLGLILHSELMDLDSDIEMLSQALSLEDQPSKRLLTNMFLMLSDKSLKSILSAWVQNKQVMRHSDISSSITETEEYKKLLKQIYDWFFDEKNE